MLVETRVFFRPNLRGAIGKLKSSITQNYNKQISRECKNQSTKPSAGAKKHTNSKRTTIRPAQRPALSSSSEVITI